MDESQREIPSRFEMIFEIQRESATREMRLADMIIATHIGREVEERLGREVESGLSPEKKDEIRNLRDEVRMAVEAVRQSFLGRFKPKFAPLFLIAERSASHSVSLSAAIQCSQLGREAEGLGLNPGELEDVQQAVRMVDHKFKHPAMNSSTPPPPLLSEAAIATT